MGKRLTRFGYCEAQATQQTLLATAGEVLRGHEFHYSDFTPETPAVMNCRKVRDGKTLQACQVDGRSEIPSPVICTFILPSAPKCSITGWPLRGMRYDDTRMVRCLAAGFYHW